MKRQTAVDSLCLGDGGARRNARLGDAVSARAEAGTAGGAAAYLSAEVLARYHYKGMPLDDALSEKIFDRYLKSLDPEKLFFVQADIDRLSGYRTTLGDAILKEDLAAPFAIFNLYEQRAAERFAYARTLLKKGFDFQQERKLPIRAGKGAVAENGSGNARAVAQARQERLAAAQACREGRQEHRRNTR